MEQKCHQALPKNRRDVRHETLVLFKQPRYPPVPNVARPHAKRQPKKFLTFLFELPDESHHVWRVAGLNVDGCSKGEQDGPRARKYLHGPCDLYGVSLDDLQSRPAHHVDGLETKLDDPQQSSRRRKLWDRGTFRLAIIKSLEHVLEVEGHLSE